jgi:hypothetical protein
VRHHQPHRQEGPREPIYRGHAPLLFVVEKAAHFLGVVVQNTVAVIPLGQSARSDICRDIRNIIEAR